MVPPQAYAAAVAVAVAVAAVVLSTAPARRGAIKTNTNEGLKPGKFKSQGRTHYYQLPQGSPAGVLLVLPGCARWGPGFWPHDKATCPECVGLTEDVSHTKQALAAGYAILVGWPVDRAFPGQYCWSAKDDGAAIVAVLEEFVTAFKLGGKPIVVTGASSGGSVALRMPSLLAWKKSPLVVSGVLAEVSTKLEVPDMVKDMSYHPPRAWIAMGENPGEIANAKRRVADYSKFGPAAMTVSPLRPVTDDYFAARHPQITPEQSRELVGAMKRIGLLAPNGRFAIDFKKDKTWVKKLQQSVPWLRSSPAYALAPTKSSAILQAMLLARAQHEHVGDYLTAALKWFESGGKASFEDLVAKYRVTRPAALTMTRRAPGATDLGPGFV